jgi:hypothetical protein
MWNGADVACCRADTIKRKHLNSYGGLMPNEPLLSHSRMRLAFDYEVPVRGLTRCELSSLHADCKVGVLAN